MRREKRFFTEKVRYELCNVAECMSWPEFIFKWKVPLFKALASVFYGWNSDSTFGKIFTQLSMYRFGSHPFQEARFHHTPLLEAVDLKMALTYVLQLLMILKLKVRLCWLTDEWELKFNSRDLIRSTLDINSMLPEPRTHGPSRNRRVVHFDVHPLSLYDSSRKKSARWMYSIKDLIRQTVIICAMSYESRKSRVICFHEKKWENSVWLLDFRTQICR
jgi:hypothetical protein